MWGPRQGYYMGVNRDQTQWGSDITDITHWALTLCWRLLRRVALVLLFAHRFFISTEDKCPLLLLLNGLIPLPFLASFSLCSILSCLFRASFLFPLLPPPFTSTLLSSSLYDNRASSFLLCICLSLDPSFCHSLCASPLLLSLLVPVVNRVLLYYKLSWQKIKG